MADVKAIVERLDKYIADYIDAPSWGGPTLYPKPPTFNDIREIRNTIEALQAKVEQLEGEALEWKTQHENLMSVRQQDLLALQARIKGLEEEIAFKNEAMQLTKGCPGKVVVRNGFYKIECYKMKHNHQALGEQP